MAGKIGTAPPPLRRRRPTRPFALHRNRLGPGPGETLSADSDAIFQCLAVSQDIIETALTRRNHDGAGLLSVRPHNRSTRYGRLPEDVEEIRERPGIQRVVVSQRGGAAQHRKKNSTPSDFFEEHRQSSSLSVNLEGFRRCHFKNWHEGGRSGATMRAPSVKLGCYRGFPLGKSARR